MLKPLVHFCGDFVIFVFLNSYSHVVKLTRFITNCIKFEVEDTWKNKRLRSTHYEGKRNFNSRWGRLLSYQDVMEFDSM